MRPFVGLLLALAFAMPTLAAAEGQGSSESRNYATILGTATLCRTPEQNGIPAGLGGTCFQISPVRTQVTVRIEDVTGPPVQGYFDFLDVDGEPIASGAFCDTAALTIPSGANILRVYVDGFVDGMLVDGCGIGVGGTVTAIFT